MVAPAGASAPASVPPPSSAPAPGLPPPAPTPTPQPEWVNTCSSRRGKLRPGGASGRPGQKGANPLESSTPALPHLTRVTDSPPARAPRGTSRPPTLALHANTMLAAPSCPGHPRLPLHPAHAPPPLAADTHAHLVLCPRSAQRGAQLSRDEQGGGGRPGILLLPFPNKDEGTRVVLVFILFFFLFPVY